MKENSNIDIACYQQRITAGIESKWNISIGSDFPSHHIQDNRTSCAKQDQEKGTASSDFAFIAPASISSDAG